MDQQSNVGTLEDSSSHREKEPCSCRLATMNESDKSRPGHLEFLRTQIPGIHKASWIFIVPLLVLAFITNGFSRTISKILVSLAIFCGYFFRVPKREINLQPNGIVAPADGVVSLISRVELPSELASEDHREFTRISIFLNIFNVHIQKIPISGKVDKILYRKGKFFNASLDKASSENERCTTLIRTNEDYEIAVVQIAGLIARIIVNDLEPNELVIKGENFGLIRFGSRVDIYLPPEITPVVYLGQHMISGETLIAQTPTSVSVKV